MTTTLPLWLVFFGAPVSVREWAAARDLDFRRLSKEDRFARIGELARRVMDEFGRFVPALPVPLVATVFALHPGRGLSELEIKAGAERLIEALEGRGAKIRPARGSRLCDLGRTRDAHVTARRRPSGRPVHPTARGGAADRVLRELHRALAASETLKCSQRDHRGLTEEQSVEDSRCLSP
ncbi:MAG TPA: hypothetical protein VLD36_01865 [Burkholderiales bacterium]|nr:hypothetical protein [Burkholderiales bacterium]